MSAPTLSLAQACVQMQLSAPACAQLSTPITPQAAVSALLASGHGEDAIKLLARLLPKRYAVAWLCQCVRGETLDEEDRAGAALAEKWVREPSEAHRRAAQAFAHAGDYVSLGAWLAAAVAWSGGSLAPPQQATPVPPADHLTARAVAAAITLLAAREPAQLEARRSGYAAHAMELLTSVGAP
ncbi:MULTISPECIES: DUF6931 family protein [Xanthomonas]|uniref:Secreted protein n=1 Tax=Xanthomonas euvesicatoria TaxID=456327 RepID=A0AAX4FK43_XANEU|nr:MULTISPECIES: hypothetical protein [Xanthomonas]MBV6788686.1 hypothetical protein [Xanthomonas campestris pv. clerodendri]MBV6867980.1 hypothetical protein [Xanthomonas campestris pv. coriandri]MBV6868698.1 hypothetical protein [Xanthomonas campestris pv. veroniae]MBV6895801.1 hypothetical protein [Xanthomonas campestris pv. ionidii]MCE4330871.1 hypothetical protein [Xanthomonas campestris pv. coriandri]